MTIYLGRISRRASRSLPGSRTVRAAPRPCLALLPAGVAWPQALLSAPVVSYTTFSLSPRFRRQAKSPATCFCGPVRQVSPPRVLPGAVPSGVRTFLQAPAHLRCAAPGGHPAGLRCDHHTSNGRKFPLFHRTEILNNSCAILPGVLYYSFAS